jgi:hypothetical protein
LALPKPVESSNLSLSKAIVRAMSDYICRMVGEASGVVGDHPVAASCSSGCEAEIHDKLDRDRQVDLADIGLRFAKRAGTSYADIRIWNKLIGVPWKIMFIGARDWVYRS